MTLWNKIKSVSEGKEHVWNAYRKVHFNAGRTAIGRISMEEYDAKRSKHLYKLWNRMVSKVFFAPPVKEIELPKKKGTTTKIGIPTICILFLLLLCTFIFAQEPDFAPPLNIPLVLNGNFGEIRGNHFHAGIDINTNGKTGLSVFSVDDGYISRIAVSATGYGNAIYISHPSGYTSVYAHLGKFAPDIASWVKSQQYRNKSFEVNLYPEKDRFVVKRGKEIAKTGNSGSSAGPHLHFEIRKTSNQHPVNPLFFHFDIQDKTSPKVENLYVYPMGNNSHVAGNIEKQHFGLVYYGGTYHLRGIQLLNVYGKIGFGVDAVDYFDNNWSRCGIYQLEYWVDNQLINSFQFDELDYSKMRYINSHIDYAAYVGSRKKIHKTFIDPGNKLDIYQQTCHNGLYNFNDGERHKIQIVLYDVNMNKSVVEFYVMSTKPVTHPEIKSQGIFYYNTDNSYTTNDIEIFVPAGALYTNLNFEYKEGRSPAGAYSPLHRVQNKYTPLQKAMNLKLKATGLPSLLREKALIALFDTGTKKFISMGGNYNQGWVETSTKNFGDFCVVADTIAPEIRSLSLRDSMLVESGRLRFKIKDDLSGIQYYTGTIDGKWMLFEFDAKRNLLEYDFDEHIKKGKNHRLQLVVEDRKGNKNIFTSTFYY